MFLMTIDLPWLVLILLVLNAVGVTLFKGPDRFYMPPIALWLGLLLLFIVLHQLNVFEQDRQQAIYDFTKGHDANRDFHTRLALENVASTSEAFTRRMVQLLGIQALFALASEVWGYRQTAQRYYLVALRTFLFISFACLVVLLLWL
ncbi:MAG: hypothetical protein JWP27_1218 [Flaviaesturariibacter sp.]|nr:hypothetical protein [Flaviaesturariibacter sp.]